MMMIIINISKVHWNCLCHKSLHCTVLRSLFADFVKPSYAGIRRWDFYTHSEIKQMRANEQTKMILLLLSRSVAVAKKADRTAYDVSYICRSEPPRKSRLKISRHGNFGRWVFRCVLWLNDTSYSKSSEKVNKKCRPRNFQPPTLTLSVITHSVTDGWTEDRRKTVSYQELRAVWSAKTELEPITHRQQ